MGITKLTESIQDGNNAANEAMEILKAKALSLDSYTARIQFWLEVKRQLKRFIKKEGVF